MRPVNLRPMIPGGLPFFLGDANNPDISLDVNSYESEDAINEAYEFEADQGEWDLDDGAVIVAPIDPYFDFENVPSPHESQDSNESFEFVDPEIHSDDSFELVDGDEFG